MKLPRHPDLANAERLLEEFQSSLLQIAERIQQDCPHIAVNQYNGLSPPTHRICQVCGLEEVGSH